MVKQGCTPGYWKQDQHFGSWVGYAPSDSLRKVFNLDAYLTNGILDLNGDGQDDTLLEALRYKGGNGLTGGLRILLRSAVAALLNASNPQVDYVLTVEQVISQVNAAVGTGDRNALLKLAADLDWYNNSGCPLSRVEASSLPDTMEMLFMPSVNR
jgi:hypothetical protein